MKNNNISFNKYAFVLSVFYLGYKQLYFTSIILSIIISISFAFSNLIGLITILIISLLCGFLFDTWYPKIQEKLKYNNSTNMAFSIMLFIFMSIILSSFIFESYYENYDFYKEIKIRNQTMNKINYTIPKGYKELGEYDQKSNYNNFKMERDNSSCFITTKNIDNYKDTAKAYLENNITYTNKEVASDIEEENINNHIWYKQTITGNDKKTTYYITKYKDNIYYIELENNFNGECDRSFNKFINSINFK